MPIKWSPFGPLPNYETCIRFEIGNKIGVIIVHDKTMGPSLGGLRVKPYDNEADMVSDAARLARGMSYKNAVAGLSIGGGKAVINARPEDITENFLLLFAEAVNVLNGDYITAPDMNTKPWMMEIIRQKTEHVTCLPETSGGLSDPSPFTARGIFLSLQAVAPLIFKQNKLNGLKIGISGYGKVGSALAKMCHDAGMLVVVSDTDPNRAHKARSNGFLTASDVLFEPIDIFSPNATGGVLTPQTINFLSQKIVTRLIIGGANNQLQNEVRDDTLLSKAGLLWIPDFVANAGGVAEAYAEWKMRKEHLPKEDMLELLEKQLIKIGERAKKIIRIAMARNITTLSAAIELAERTVSDNGGKLR